jgi:multidrug transporter EmrE-like cation transporter
VNWTPLVWLELLCFPVAMAAGQILFKRTAAQMTGVSGAWLLELAKLPSMWLALALYAASTLLWVKILTSVPLSRAYPVAALSFILVPAAGYLFFNEPINARLAAGTALIIAGVIVAVRA